MTLAPNPHPPPERTGLNTATQHFGALGSLLNSCFALCTRAARVSMRGQRDISFKSAHNRRVTVKRACKDLHHLGYKIRDVHNIRTRHVRALCRLWESRYAASTLATYTSILTWMLLQLGKAEIASRLPTFFGNPQARRRHLVSMRDKSEKAMGLTREEVYQRVSPYDPRVACQLKLAGTFGLRVKESWLFRPHLDLVGSVLIVRGGTKGGRPRVLPISLTSGELEVIREACEMVPNRYGSMVPADMSLRSWQHHYYWVLRKAGLTKRQLGVTPHSLRHGKVQRVYRQVSGQSSPLQRTPSEPFDRRADLVGRRIASEYAGHSRVEIVGAYCGSVRLISAAARAQDPETTAESASQPESDSQGGA